MLNSLFSCLLKEICLKSHQPPPNVAWRSRSFLSSWFSIPAKTAGCKCLVKDGCPPHPSRHACWGWLWSFLPSAAQKWLIHFPKVTKHSVGKSLCTWAQSFNRQWYETNAKRISIHPGVSTFQTFYLVWFSPLQAGKLLRRHYKSLVPAILWKQHQLFTSD